MMEGYKLKITCVQHSHNTLCFSYPQSQKAQDAWVMHSTEVHSHTVMNEAAKTRSWIMGSNLVDKKPRVLAYFGGANTYADKLTESVRAAFPELDFGSI